MIIDFSKYKLEILLFILFFYSLIFCNLSKSRVLFIESNDEASQYFGRKPGENTIAYYPLDSESALLDKSGNNRNLTNSGVNIGTYDGIECAYFNGSSRAYMSSNLPDTSTPTLAFRTKFNFGDISQRAFVFFDGDSNGGRDFGFAFNRQSGYNQFYWGVKNSGQGQEGYITVGSRDSSKRNCVIITYESSSVKIYINNELAYTVSVSNALGNTGYHYLPQIGGLYDGGSSASQFFKGYLSNLVYSTTIRTEEERNNFYNNTKKKYGL